MLDVPPILCDHETRPAPLVASCRKQTTMLTLCHLPCLSYTEAVRDACVGLVAEDHPLLLNYSKRVGGRPAIRTENHLKNHVDMVLLVHNEGATFTCNKRVTVDDTFGFGTDASPSVQLMSDLEYEGAATDIVMRPLQFLINRYVNCVMHAVQCRRSWGFVVWVQDGTRVMRAWQLTDC